jgi:hypothetical protein
MLDFDEDRPSITGRKVASNIPPTIAGYEQSRPYLKWLVIVMLIPVLLLLVLVYFFR